MTVPCHCYQPIRLLLLCCLLLAPTLATALNCATPGKDGAGGSLSGVVNTYYPAAGFGTLAAGSTSLNLGSPAGTGISITTGDLLLIIQMQHADINSTDTDSYGDGVAGGNASGYTSLQAGAYEFVVATSNLVAGSVNIQGTGAGNGLINSYIRSTAGTQGQRTYQIIRVPQYTTASLSSGLTALPWNGSVGGVLALDIQNNLTLTGTVDLSARGFRGGGSIQRGNSGGSTTEYRTTAATNRNSSKGEGIAGTPRYVYSNINGWLDNGGTDGYPNGDFAMGAPGNAGGGGVDINGTNHNPGGGGGGNGGVGGRGGFTWNSSPTNGSNVGGFGGATVTAAANRIILGGGGGAGSRNDSAGPDGSGGAGGGLVLVRTDTISGAGTITVNGGNGLSSLNEGGGGGGAGGSVLFFAETSGSLAGLTINARGGNGGLAWPAQAGTNNAHGPGAGGGGGAVLTSTGGAAINASGGINGTTTTGALAYGATAGGSGTTSTITATGIPGIVGGASCQLLISGTVFDDVNYGGNAGRDYATANASATGSGFASGAIRSANSRVELYDASGNYLTTQNTNGTGQYSFLRKPGSYQLRVVNNTVNAVRGGTGLFPVQTFRSEAPAGTVVAITNEIGGASPADTDAGNNSSSTIAALNAVAGQTVQTLSPVVTTTNDLAALDFGFNFSTIVNTNDSGQGSLRQFITHANALGNANLDQDSNGTIDPAAGVESSIFMVPATLLSSGVASITLASQLPSISSAFTHIDGRTQSSNTTTSTGDTNNNTLGTITSVGTGSTPLNGIPAPEVEIVDGASIANGLTINASNTLVRGIAIYGFGSNSNNNGNIDINTASSNIDITETVIGSTSTSFSSPPAINYTGISIGAGADVSIQNSLIGFHNRAAIYTNNNAITLSINGSEIRNANQATTGLGAIDLNSISTFSMSNSLVSNNRSSAVELNSQQGLATIIGNTIQDNGSGGDRTAGLLMRSTTGSSLIEGNVITGNTGNGILVATANPGTLVTENAIYNNGQLGIDLQPGRTPINGSSPYVTQNDNGDGDSGSNDLLNFPVISSARVMGGNLVLAGFAPAGSSIEWFVSDGGSNPNPNPFSIDFGEGQTYLATTVEGSGADLDNTTGSYTGDSCAIASCTENRFRFSIPLPAGVSIGTLITATASDGVSTSEFSGNYSVIGFPGLSVNKSVAVESDGFSSAGFGKAIPGATMVYTITITNSGDGDVDADSLVITDQVPANTTFINLPFDGSTNSPVKFTAGASGVTVTFDPSDEANDDVDFATDGVPTWNAASTDTPITHFRVRPQGAMAFDPNPAVNPGFTLQFKVTVN